MTKFVRKSREERCFEIRNAALDIFIEKGYTATTMEDIVASVNLSKGSVYKYYPFKHLILTDLLKDGVHIRNNIMLEYMKNRELSSEEFSKAITALFFADEANGKYAKLYAIFLYEKTFDSNLEKVYEDIMDYGIKNIEYADMVDINTILGIVTIMNTLIMGKFILSKEFDNYVDDTLVNEMFLNLLERRNK